MLNVLHVELTLCNSYVLHDLLYNNIRKYFFFEEFLNLQLIKMIREI